MRPEAHHTRAPLEKLDDACGELRASHALPSINSLPVGPTYLQSKNRRRLYSLSPPHEHGLADFTPPRCLMERRRFQARHLGAPFLRPRSRTASRSLRGGTVRSGTVKLVLKRPRNLRQIRIYSRLGPQNRLASAYFAPSRFRTPFHTLKSGDAWAVLASWVGSAWSVRAHVESGPRQHADPRSPQIVEVMARTRSTPGPRS